VGKSVSAVQTAGSLQKGKRRDKDADRRRERPVRRIVWGVGANVKVRTEERTGRRFVLRTFCGGPGVGSRPR